MVGFEHFDKSVCGLSKEGFPGDPLVEAPDGHPLTHAILDRLGLIKQAEENSPGKPSLFMQNL
jgi:hypothetical protein